MTDHFRATFAAVDQIISNEIRSGGIVSPGTALGVLTEFARQAAKIGPLEPGALEPRQTLDAVLALLAGRTARVLPTKPTEQ